MLACCPCPRSGADGLAERNPLPFTSINYNEPRTMDCCGVGACATAVPIVGALARMESLALATALGRPCAPLPGLPTILES